MLNHRALLLAAACAIPLLVTACAHAPGAGSSAALTLARQGSFAVGGAVVQAPGRFDPLQPANPAGQTLHGDHARVVYQVPIHARPLPLMLWHGFGQSAAGWQTTPDGREGFDTLLLRQRYAVYLIDQPRRGHAAKATVAGSIGATPDEQRWFNQFRIGNWPEFFPGVQFSRDPEALNQYFRQMVPDTAPLDAGLAINAVSALFDRVGSGILVTHSHSGGMGWQAAMRNVRIRAIVSYEPGSGFIFPQGEAPAPMPSSADTLQPVSVPLDEFKKLTHIPIVIYYGDNIPTEPSALPGQDNWRTRLAMARVFVSTINRHGGDATLVHLPAIGIRGNTHFPFSDMNNAEIAKLMAQWLSVKSMD